MANIAPKESKETRPGRAGLRSTPVTEMLEWLESNSPFNIRGLGLAPYVRVEDFVDDDTYVLRAELPGIDPDRDVAIELVGDRLTISGERREERRDDTGDKTHREFHYGSFRRTVSVPRGVQPEDVTATYADGVLEIRVPADTGRDAQARMIPVQRKGQ
ncbi:MAG TPA: Hsp20/alpha crystallin family protein [Nocardioidaceae bacterium]|jgi:HSP20 family molecular chaperone IbpA|nr:Hsp20/alpha crystallin family protein [Nocardioidaceae bacterium]